MKHKSLEERFNAKWSYSPGCWNWMALKNSDGYGRIKTGKKLGRAHRVSYELHIGPIPKDACVLHRCDNPSCVNPDHFFLGSHAENMADKKAKGRCSTNGGRILEDNDSRCKVTATQAAEIRDSSLPNDELATMCGLTKVSIARIKNRTTWRNI